MTPTKDHIRSIVKKVLHAKQDMDAFADHEPLRENGRLDSMDVAELLFAIEDEFGLDFGDKEFDPMAANSVNEMARYVDNEKGSI